ncbi:hypothetical protein AC1031_020573 [Aphanomyces cochlioides]|nr:hypothetical protein AC1031_020573 [Aphanomyces cochlioides]
MAPMNQTDLHSMPRGRPSIKKRLAIINYARDNSIHKAIRVFFGELVGASRKLQWKRINRWQNDRENIEKLGTNPATKHMKTKREIFTVTSLTKEEEEQIANWVRTLRQDGIPMSRLLLAAKALDVAATTGFLTPQEFKASSQWINGFMTRWVCP